MLHGRAVMSRFRAWSSIYHLLANNTTDMSATTLLIIYAVGVIINAFMAASIWDDLTEDRQLKRIRFTVLLFFVLASYGTWLYALVYTIASWIKSRTTRKNDTDEPSEHI